MRIPRAWLTIVSLAACGDSGGGGSAASSSQASEASATGVAAETGQTGTPTGGEPPTTAATDSGVTDSGLTDSGPVPTTGGAESTGAASTGAASTGAVDSSTGMASASSTGEASTGEASSTGAGESSTGPGCPEGQDGCACGPGDSCDGNLVCAQGLCGPGPLCGDGKLDPGEGCDDGANNGDDKACKADCTKQVCGDGKVGPGEACDDGGNNGDMKACKSDCTKQVCGDGKLGPGEACDDGANNGDMKACKADCTKQVCGDGKVGPGEACDDGNQINGDGCEKTCVKTPNQGLDACGYASGDGVWFQIDYSNANTVSSPSYTYSPTPGWGEAEWAPTGKGWPYAVDLFNNASVVNDQIGKVALLNGTNKAVRVYFGIAGLDYEYATVCVEGRSYSVGSSVTFFVMEAKTKNGDYGMMANDWTVHATGVDMQHFFISNDEFQAVQVQPSGGSGALSLKRLRVTLHGASY